MRGATDFSPHLGANYMKSVENRGKENEILCKYFVYYFKIQVFNRAKHQVLIMLIHQHFKYAVFFSCSYPRTSASSVFL